MLVQSVHAQRPESHEIPVIREDPFNTVLLADSCDLRIKHQVAMRVRLACRRKQPLQKLVSGPNDLATWCRNERFDKLSGLNDSRWRVEHFAVGHHPHEFRNAEHRQRPSFRSFTQSGQLRRRRLVQFAFGPMRIDQDVRVDR